MPASYSLAPEVEGEVAACSGAFGCFEAVAGSIVALVLWAGLSTGLLFAPRANVRAALAALRRETEAVQSEQEALSTFITEVEALPATGPVSTVEGGGVGVVGAKSQPSGMGKLRETYRETLMDVAHFERDYGESFPENIASEFGDGVATAVLANDGLSPQIKRGVLSSATEGRAQRERYLETLDRERRRLETADDALDRAATRCTDLDAERLRRHSFDDLQSRYERLERERNRLSDVLARRQEQLQDGVAFGWQRKESEPVYRYLYQDVDATYPVLADGATVLARMDEVERRITTGITAKV